MNRTKFQKPSLAWKRLSGLEIITKSRSNVLEIVEKVRQDRFDPTVINPKRRKDKMNAEKKILNKYKKLVKDFNALPTDKDRILFMKRRKGIMCLSFRGAGGTLAPDFKIPENESDKIKEAIFEISGDLRKFSTGPQELVEILFEILGLDIRL